MMLELNWTASLAISLGGGMNWATYPKTGTMRVDQIRAASGVSPGGAEPPDAGAHLGQRALR